MTQRPPATVPMRTACADDPVRPRPARRGDYLQREGLDRIHAGGRWHRLLLALRDQPRTTGDLFRATDPGQHDPRTERRKVKAAARDMARLSLIEQRPPWGWILTDAGKTALDHLDTSPTAEDGQTSGA